MAVSSDKLSTSRAVESPVAFECKIKRISSLGEECGAGYLVLFEILLVHIKEAVLDEKGFPDPAKMDWAARLGGSYYHLAMPETICSVYPRFLVVYGRRSAFREHSFATSYSWAEVQQ